MAEPLSNLKSTGCRSYGYFIYLLQLILVKFTNEHKPYHFLYLDFLVAQLEEGFVCLFSSYI